MYASKYVRAGTYVRAGKYVRASKHVRAGKCVRASRSTSRVYGSESTEEPWHSPVILTLPLASLDTCASWSLPGFITSCRAFLSTCALLATSERTSF